jgi:predicted transcriptional regulator
MTSGDRYHRALEQRGEARHEVRDDAMDPGLRDREHGGELAQREVGAERDADDTESRRK